MEPIELSKAEVMRKLQEALSETAIVKAKIWNPWDDACEEGIDLKEVQGVANLTAAPTTIPEDTRFGDLKLVTKAAYVARYRELSKSMDVNLTAETFDSARLLLKTGYLQWGRANWRGVTGGNCTYFAGVTIGFLSDNSKLVPEGATVEQFNLLARGEGHAFVVIGRDPQSTSATLATWGKRCFIVDQWYARQRRTSPGIFAVKDLEQDSPFYDAAFLKFIREGGTISRGPAFSYQELTQLR